MNKFFLKSKTIIGAIVATLPTLLPAIGISWSADDSLFISSNFDLLIEGLGIALVAIGRFAAGGLSVNPRD